MQRQRAVLCCRVFEQIRLQRGVHDANSLVLGILETIIVHNACLQSYGVGDMMYQRTVCIVSSCTQISIIILQT